MSSNVIAKTDYRTKVILCQKYDKWRAKEENYDKRVDAFVHHMHVLLTRKEEIGENPNPEIQSLRLKFHGKWAKVERGRQTDTLKQHQSKGKKGKKVRRVRKKKTLKLHQCTGKSLIKEIVTQCEFTQHTFGTHRHDYPPQPTQLSTQVALLAKTNCDGGPKHNIGIDLRECQNACVRHKSEVNWSASQAAQSKC